MNTTLFSVAALAATALVPLTAAHAQTTLAQDNASSTAYINSGGGSSYNGGQNGGTGFGAFNVASTGSAGTFIYTASESEGGNGTPAPGSIDSPATATSGSPLSFGVFAQTLGSSATITRSFTAPAALPGEAFSLDFVTGYNDGLDANGNAGGGTSGVSLLTAGGTAGTFEYQSNDQYLFNGTLVTKADGTKQDYDTGAFHLLYTLTSPTAYTLQVSGPFDFTGTGTLTSPVTGFEVAQTNSGSQVSDHNAYFNNLSLTAPAAVPEASSSIGFGVLLTLGGLTLAARKRRAQA
jgi:hypothetical protein